MKLIFMSEPVNGQLNRIELTWNRGRGAEENAGRYLWDTGGEKEGTHIVYNVVMYA